MCDAVWAFTKWSLLGLAVLIAGAVGVGLVFRIALLEYAAESWLTAKGVSPVHIHIVAFDTQELVLGRTRIGGSLEFDRLALAYSPAALWDGHLRSVNWQGLRAAAALRDGAPESELLEKLGIDLEAESTPPQDENAAPLPWPFDGWRFRKLSKASLQHTELTVETDIGTVRLDIPEAVAAFADRRLTADAALRLLYGESDLEFDVTAMVPESGAPEIGLTVVGGKIDEAQGRVTVDGGQLALVLDDAPLPHLDGALRFRDIAFQGTEIDEVSVSGQRQDSGDVAAKLAVRTGAALLDLTALVTDPLAENATLVFDGSATLRDVAAFYAAVPVTVRQSLALPAAPSSGRLWSVFDGRVRLGALRQAAEAPQAIDWNAWQGAAANLLISLEALQFDEAERFDLAMDIAAAVTSTGLTLNWKNPITLSAAGLPWQLLPVDLADNLRNVAQLTEPLKLTVAPPPRPVRVPLPALNLIDSAVAFELTTDERPWIAATVDAMLHLPEEGTEIGVTIAEASLDLARTRYRDLAVAVSALNVAGTASSRSADITVQGNLDVTQRLQGRRMNAVVTLDGQTFWNDGAVTYKANVCQIVRHNAIAIAGLTLTPVTWQLCPVKEAPYLAALEPGGGLSSHVSVRYSPALTLTLPAGEDTERVVTLAPGSVTLNSGFTPAGQAWRTALSASAVSATLSEPAIGGDVALALQPFRLRAAGRGASLDSVSSQVQMRITDKRRPVDIAPLNLTGTLGGKAGKLAGEFSVMDLSGNSIAAIQLAHDLGTGAGNARVGTPSWQFQPAGLQPQKWLPVLKGKVTDVAGNLQLNAAAEWTGQGFKDGSAKITVGQLGMETPFAVIGGIDGTVEFDRLLPLQTPVRQTIDIASLDVGLVLKKGRIVFNLPGNDRIYVEEAAWPFAGGRLAIEDVDAKLQTDKRAFSMVAQDIDLQQLLNDLDINGLSGTGVLSGRLPIVVQHNVAIVRKGILEAGPQGGVLRYVDKDTTSALADSHQGGALLTQALEDFHYKKLALKIDGVTSGRIDVDFNLEGANPALYDGYPVALNLSVSGALAEIARNGLASFKITDQLREQLTNQ